MARLPSPDLCSLFAPCPLPATPSLSSSGSDERHYLLWAGFPGRCGSAASGWERKQAGGGGVSEEDEGEAAVPPSQC